MDADVKTLLNVWGLSQYIANFEANKIDIKSLGLLDAVLSKELIGPVGDRAIFLKNLENWKAVTENSDLDDAIVIEDLPMFVDTLKEKHRNLPFEEISNTHSDDKLNTCMSSPTSTDLTTITESLALEKLLKSTIEGKFVLNLYKESGLLSGGSRRKLCNIIIRHLLSEDPEKRISSSVLLDYAQQIKLLFPKENISTYFIPYVNNTQLKIKRCAKGKLYDCLQNRKREFREAKIIKKQLTQLDAQDTDEVEDFNEDEIKFLNISCEPWSLVEDKWRKTVKYRLKQLNEKKMTVGEYLQLYPALKKPTGFHLLLQDFQYLYANYENNFHENFQLYREKLINILLKKHNRSSDLTIQNLMQNLQEHHSNKTNYVKSEEATNVSILSLLALTLTQPQSKNKKTTWRPSKIETKDGFITQITRFMDLQETINRRREKFSKIGVTIQPFIVVVGSGNTDIECYYIIVNDTYYVINSILKAVDSCFKIFFALNCSYPQECVVLWTFIQKAFYRLKTPWDKDFISVNTFLSELEIDS